MNSSEKLHLPVLLNQVLEALSWGNAPLSCFCDFTLGGGGHFKALLENNSSPATVFGFDQDQETLKRTSEIWENETKAKETRFHFVHDNFSHFEKYISQPIDRALVDLGVSSFQLDEAARGFSFQKEGPLDMRMDPSRGFPASEWLSEVTETDFADVVFQLGEERKSRFLARRFVEARGRKPIETTKDFVEAFGHRLDSKDHQGRHPLTKVFQAVRLHVNDELGHLSRFLDRIPMAMAPGGRLAIISFHSLEDRMVKHRLRDSLKRINKKVIMAESEERRSNPRSRSAKLRIFEKL